MKRFISILSVIIVLAFLVSCSEEWLDVNTDPNSPEAASAELVLSTGTLELATVVGGYYNLLGGFWAGYWTQSNAANQYKYIDQYNIIETDFEDQWEEMYISALSDLRYVRNQAKVDEDWSVYLMATVLEAYGFQVLVDLYDNVPYSEALGGQTSGNFSPIYDDGQDIYDSLITNIDEALGKELNELSTSKIAQDLVFGAGGGTNGLVHQDLWIRFANTLKLKMYIRQMYARPAVAQAGIQAMYNAGDEFLTTSAMLDIFVDQKNADNPLYASDRRNLNTATNLRASAPFYNYLQANADPRYDYLIDLAPDGTAGVPLPQGGFSVLSTNVDPTTVSVFLITPTMPVVLISEAESYFLQAEAVAMGWGSGDAAALYNAGVTAAFNFYGLDASAFIAAGGAYEYPTGGTFEEQQEAIIMAKWASMAATQTIEAFFEANRTHYPVEYMPVGNNYADRYDDALYSVGVRTYSLEGLTQGQFPKRLIVPRVERLTNTNVPAEMKSAKVTDKVWWDTK